MNKRIVAFVFAAAATAALAGCRPAADYRTQRDDAEPLHDAMGQLTGVVVYDIFSPPQASRVYAYASIAAFEALRHEHSGYRSLAGQLNGLRPVPEPAPDSQYHLPLAGVHAFMTVGKALTFSQARMDSLRSAMHERFRRMRIPAPVFNRSIAYGDTVAQHILAWARTDRFVQRVGYPKFTVTSEPGRWVPTPPAYMDAVEPNWAMVRPFVLDSASQFRPKPPPAFDTARTSPFFRQVVEVYETTRRLTDEQRTIAAFWNDNPYTLNVQGHTMFATKLTSPGGHWMAITQLAAKQTDADVMRSAEAYTRTAIAIADAFIACWEEKYRSNLVRPETVINAHIDETWQPLLQTPPFPEYTSGHSVISNAAATVLTDQFGDGFAFRDETEKQFGLPVRSFRSFREAAAEAALSRLYGGIHYRAAIAEGSVQGRKVGEFVVRRVQTRTAIAAEKNTAPRGTARDPRRNPPATDPRPSS